MVTNNRSIWDGLTAGNGTSDNAYLDNLEKEKSLRRSWYQTKTPTSDADLAAAEKLTNQSLNDLYKTPQPTQNQQSGIAATTTTSTQPAQNVQPLKPVPSPQSIGATMPVSNDGAIKKNSLASTNPSLSAMTNEPGMSYIDATQSPLAGRLTNTGDARSLASIPGIQNGKVYKTLDANGRAVFSGTDGSSKWQDGRTEQYKQEVADRNAAYTDYMNNYAAESDRMALERQNANLMSSVTADRGNTTARNANILKANTSANDNTRTATDSQRLMEQIKNNQAVNQRMIEQNADTSARGYLGLSIQQDRNNREDQKYADLAPTRMLDDVYKKAQIHNLVNGKPKDPNWDRIPGDPLKGTEDQWINKNDQRHPTEQLGGEKSPFPEGSVKYKGNDKYITINGYLVKQ